MLICSQSSFIGHDRFQLALTCIIADRRNKHLRHKIRFNVSAPASNYGVYSSERPPPVNTHDRERIRNTCANARTVIVVDFVGGRVRFLIACKWCFDPTSLTRDARCSRLDLSGPLSSR